MERIAISKFKATCLAVIEEVKRTGTPVVVTRRGVPMAEIVPARVAKERGDWMGSWRGKCVITGDIVAPALDEDEIEALRD
ncbi:MAG TPA: type II toxin-antitoxin system Phd/YefM family antitoxin [Terriglobales bacterium]|nr:type II toxin-antitoxin system Phd/YefM family antitoxin [Terriglobales bacterium]